MAKTMPKSEAPRVLDVQFLVYDHNYGKFRKKRQLRQLILKKFNGRDGLKVNKVVVKETKRGRPRRKSR